MNDNAGIKYLISYSTKTELSVNKYFDKEIKEASLIGKSSSELLKKFATLAKKGKKIRGALVVLGYQLAGGVDLKTIEDTSIFIEIFHSGILVHDDIVDEADMRRGLMTIHKQYQPYHFGQSMAVCAGDIAFYLSLNKLLSSKFPKERIIEAGKIYSDYVKRLIYGQILDINNHQLENTTQEEILNIFRYKTAEYTGVLPLLIGATLAGINDKQKISLLKEFGLCLGWVFQIRDDILGMYGDANTTGKPVGSDLIKGKITLFILHLFKHGNTSQINYIKQILGKKNINNNQLSEVQKILKQTDSYNYAINLGKQYVDKGLKIIPRITSNKKLANVLKSLLIYILERIN